MTDLEEFEPFPKMSRLNRAFIITEKIDGTNGQLVVLDDLSLHVGSRKRFITPRDDNFGFARWAYENEEAIVTTLGPGRHYGEWWGSGIQRGYGLDVKRFSLFNTSRWSGVDLSAVPNLKVVPTLYMHTPSEDCAWYHAEPIVKATQRALRDLEENGSAASPGFMKPEGVVLFHAAANTCFKVTLENDGRPKGSRETK